MTPDPFDDIASRLPAPCSDARFAASEFDMSPESTRYDGSVSLGAGAELRLTQPEPVSDSVHRIQSSMHKSIGLIGDRADNAREFGPGIQLAASRIDDDLAAIFATARSQVPNVVETWIDQYEPAALAGRPEAIRFVRDVIVAVEPRNTFSASQIGVAVSGLVAWAYLSEGLPLRRGVLLNRQVTDMYLKVLLLSKSAGTVRNYRGYLEQAALAFGIGDDLLRAPIRGKNVAAPYSCEREAMFEPWARSQGTPLAVGRAFALVGLAAGAGLSNAEIVGVQVRHIIDAGGLWVRVHGGRDRLTPVREVWAPYLRRRIQSLRPDDLVFPPGDAEGRRLVEKWLCSLPPQRNRPVAGRLRATWLTAHLRAETKPEQLLEWSGIERGETIADYLQYVPEVATEGLRRTFVHLRTPRSGVI